MTCANCLRIMFDWITALAPLLQSELPAVPADFRLTAWFASGGTSALPWEATITADGKCVVVVFEEGNRRKSIESRWRKEDVVYLVALLKKYDIDNKKSEYDGGIEDSWGFGIKVMAHSRLRQISVLGVPNLKEDQDARTLVDLWRKLLPRIPSPNEGAEVDLIEDAWK